MQPASSGYRPKSSRRQARWPEKSQTDRPRRRREKPREEGRGCPLGPSNGKGSQPDGRERGINTNLPLSSVDFLRTTYHIFFHDRLRYLPTLPRGAADDGVGGASSRPIRQVPYRGATPPAASSPIRRVAWTYGIPVATQTSCVREPLPSMAPWPEAQGFHLVDAPSCFTLSLVYMIRRLPTVCCVYLCECVCMRWQRHSHCNPYDGTTPRCEPRGPGPNEPARPTGSTASPAMPSHTQFTSSVYQFQLWKVVGKAEEWSLAGPCRTSLAR